MHPNPHDIAVVISTGFSMLVFVLAFRVLMSTFVEEFRQSLFDVRAELFLFMAERKIKAVDPAYTSTRRALNGLLRFAQKLTFLRAVCSSVLIKDWTAAHLVQAEAEIQILPDEEGRKFIRACRHKYGRHIAFHLLKTSPFLWLLILIGVILVFPILLYKACKAAVRSFVDRISTTAEAEATALPSDQPPSANGGQTSYATGIF